MKNKEKLFQQMLKTTENSIIIITFYWPVINKNEKLLSNQNDDKKARE